MIKRTLSTKIQQLSEKFPIVTVTGPRQSGKSTLLRSQFPDYRYVSLENLDMREFASRDPHGFLATYDRHVIIDEAERAPSLFSYLQTHVDEANESGMYMLAGSRNFHLMEAIDQSLAGRTAVLKLLPFSRLELHDAGALPSSINDQIFTGFYPRIYDKDIAPTDYYPSYISTYVERDVRTILKVTDLNRFTRFIRLCAGRIGQLLNMSALATEAGVSKPTIESWLSVLEASYILYRLEPNFNNYNKRIVKTPKLYFYDTGLACSLLGITSSEQLDSHFLRGGLFENMVVNQFIKQALNAGIKPDLTFWRDSAGLEVDLIRTNGLTQSAYEIKSGSTFHPDYFKGLQKWSQLSGTPPENLAVIYGGSTPLHTSYGAVLPLPSQFSF
ncbi:MAG: ATP-binding protein [Muribaculaceae bacterium]|nr:ATP-binding protein [Muribaculaceae bacterium]